MINVAVQFKEDTIPGVIGNAGLNITVSFPSMAVTGGGGLQLLTYITSGNNIQIVPGLMNKNLLALDASGGYLEGWAFTSSTGSINYNSDPDDLTAGVKVYAYYKNQ